MRILIRTLNNECFKVSCEPNDTVMLVKDLVAKTLRCDACSVRLILNGQQLADDQSLGQAGVREECHLGVVVLKVSSPEKPESEIGRAGTESVQNRAQSLPSIANFQK
jgi:hypothetical protein